MKGRRLWLFMGGAVVVLAGLAMASNMGFKLNYTLQTNAAGNNLNWVSLPYFNNYTVAEDVVTDVDGDCGAGTVSNVKKFDPYNNSYTTHFPGSSKNNFTIDTGISYGVKVSASCTWIIVGSHDDNYDPGGSSSVNLILSGGGISTDNWVSVPYHTTLSNAEDLCGEIGSTASSVRMFDTPNNSYTTHICGSTKNKFSLTPGLGVAVRVSSNTSWHPSHY